MNLAVLTYQHVDNPKGIPNAWPAEVIELGNDTSLPGVNWVLMSTSEYLSYIAQYQGQYDTWAASNLVDPIVGSSTLGHTITCGYSGMAIAGRTLEISGNPAPFISTEDSFIKSIAVYSGENTTGTITVYINDVSSATLSLNNTKQNTERGLNLSIKSGERVVWKVTSGIFRDVNFYTFLQSNVDDIY